MNWPYIAPLIAHEIGHWSVAKSLGTHVGEIQFQFFYNGFRASLGTHNATATSFPEKILSNLEQVYSFSIQRIATLYAGACAEVLTSHEKMDMKKIEVVLQQNGSHDNARIEESLLIAAGVHPTEKDLGTAKGLANEEGYKLAVKHVVHSWDFICGVVEATKSHDFKEGRWYELSAASLNTMWSKDHTSAETYANNISIIEVPADIRS